LVAIRRRNFPGGFTRSTRFPHLAIRRRRALVGWARASFGVTPGEFFIPPAPARGSGQQTGRFGELPRPEWEELDNAGPWPKNALESPAI
jgi:hypothetical protein